MAYSTVPPARWGKEAAGVSMTSFHALREDNPHLTTAGQVGAYSKTEIDSKITEALSGVATDNEVAPIATAVAENTAQIDDILSKLATLEYTEPAITSFTVTPGTAEVGSSVTEVTITVVRNKMNLPVYVTGDVSAVIPAGLNTVTVSASLVAPSKTLTATITDPAEPPGRIWTATRTARLEFLYPRYWGVSEKAVLTGSDLLTLNNPNGGDPSKDLGGTIGPKSITYNATGGRYLYYAYPAEWGSPENVTIGSLALSAFEANDVSHTNTLGITRPYRILRLSNIQHGAAININWQ